MSCPNRRIEAMKKPSRAGGGKPSKARSRRSSGPKRDIAPKAVAHRNAATDRVAEWLKKLDLGQYAQRFAENDISFAVLPDLTEQDLKDIGVRSSAPVAARNRRPRQECRSPSIRFLADSIPPRRHGGSTRSRNYRRAPPSLK
jgi:hypothetical protein